jgi:DNA anti-recombination protein RmuC
MDFSKFDLLETRLGSVLDRLKALESDNSTLKTSLVSAQKDLDSAKKEIAELIKVRDSVVLRIDNLLERMNSSLGD